MSSWLVRLAASERRRSGWRIAMATARGCGLSREPSPSPSRTLRPSSVTRQATSTPSAGVSSGRSFKSGSLVERFLERHLDVAYRQPAQERNGERNQRHFGVAST